MDKVTFEAGDTVTCAFYGNKEFVLEKSNSIDYPLCFSVLVTELFTYTKAYYFTTDGRTNKIHTSPVLKLVRKHIKENELVTVYTIRVHMIGRYREEFDTYEKAVEWIKTNGNSKMDYKIDKIFRVKE